MTHLFALAQQILLVVQTTPLPDSSGGPWYAGSPASALVWTAVFSIFGTFLAIVGYKLFDKATPGDLHQEIIQNRNVAAAILGAAVILGVCIVVAAAIMG